MDCVSPSLRQKLLWKRSLPWMAPLAFPNTGRCLKEKSVPWNSRHSEQLERMWSGDASGFGKMPKVQANCWTHKQRNHRTGRFIYSYVKPSAQVQKSELNLTDNYLVSAPTHSMKRNPPPLYAIGSIRSSGEEKLKCNFSPEGPFYWLTFNICKQARIALFGLKTIVAFHCFYVEMTACVFGLFVLSISVFN